MDSFVGLHSVQHCVQFYAVYWRLRNSVLGYCVICRKPENYLLNQVSL
jgi:hypothetical protein